MRKLLYLALAFLLFVNCSAQSLRWANSFSPVWSNGSVNGNAYNLGGSNINSSINIGISGGSFGPASGNNGPLSPTVFDAVYTDPSSTGLIELAPNFSNNAQYATLTINFSSLVKLVSFYIVDIDKKNPTNAKHLDRVSVTGANGSASYNPVITKFDAVTDPNFLLISGNTVNVNPADGQGGDAASDILDQRGTILVSFGAALINAITIIYDNAPGANNNPGSQSIGISNILFSPITLPVNLVEFNSHRLGQDIVLGWKTEQEINTQSFIVERNNGTNWEAIGTVAASGNTNNPTSYSYTDLHPQGSLLLYRLKQTDIDNKFTYSGIIRIMNQDSKASLLSYPNPFTRQVNVSINSAYNQPVTATVIDASGKILRSDRKELYAGNNNFTITGLEAFTRGVYYILIRDASGNTLGETQLLKN
ncbi:MAG: T9SS type A sorting domain-containing protein [Chitinophagaceae bacterium]